MYGRGLSKNKIQLYDKNDKIYHQRLTRTYFWKEINIHICNDYKIKIRHTCTGHIRSITLSETTC